MFRRVVSQQGTGRGTILEASLDVPGRFLSTRIDFNVAVTIGLDDRRLQADLAKLGYTRKWIDAGILDLHFFRWQLYDWTASDQYPFGQEHWRYGAVRRYLHDRSGFTNEELVRLLEVAEEDTEIGLPFLYDLLRHPALSDEQADHLVAHPAATAHHPIPEKSIRQLAIRRRLARREPPTDELIQECIDSGNGSIQETLLFVYELEDRWLAVLAESGASKTVRHQGRMIPVWRKKERDRKAKETKPWHERVAALRNPKDRPDSSANAGESHDPAPD